MTKPSMTQLFQIGYQGNAHTLENELRFLPHDVAEWTRRVNLFTNELRNTMPCKSAMRSEAKYTKLNQVHTSHCIDGVMTSLAEKQRVIKGEWIVSDYLTEPAKNGTDTLPATVSLDRSHTNPPETGTKITITQYEYFVTRGPDDQKASHRYPSHTVNAPPEARLWLGMDINPWNGAHVQIELKDLGTALAQTIEAKYNVELPDAATITKISDLIFDAGANPLTLAADCLEAAVKTRVTGLWHPYIQLLM